jgi:CBS domain-containing protein
MVANPETRPAGDQNRDTSLFRVDFLWRAGPVADGRTLQSAASCRTLGCYCHIEGKDNDISGAGKRRAREGAMILDMILREKGREVYSVAESASLKEAAELLDARRVGAMVILNEAGHLAGVISERDIVRCIARNGAGALKLTVADVMTRQVVTARPSETIEQAMNRMTDRRIRHLPVVEGHQLIGVVSIGDLVARRIAEAHAEVDAIRSYIQP